MRIHSRPPMTACEAYENVASDDTRNRLAELAYDTQAEAK